MLLGNDNRLVYFLFFSLLLFSQTVFALTITPEASVGLKYSNNPLLRDSNIKGSWVFTGVAGAAIQARSKIFSLAANTSIRSESYSNGDLNVDDKYYFNLGLSTKMDIIQRKFSLLLNDSFKQTLIDTSNPRIPDNFQDTNVVTFGADIRIPLTPRQKLTLTPRYRDFYYETTDADNKQFSSTLSWSYAVNPLLTFSLNAGVTEVTYENNDVENSDYVSNDFGVGITRKQKRSNINARFGVTKIKRDALDDQEGFTGSIGWSRELSDKSRLHLSIKSALRDSSQSLLESPAGQESEESPVGLEEEEITRDVLRSDSFRVTYNGRKSAAAVNVWASMSDLDYKETLRDRKLKSFGFQLDYQLMKLVKSAVFGNYRFTDEVDLAREDRLKSFGVLANYRLSRLLSCSFKLQNLNNQSDVESFEYIETSVYMSVSYGQ